MSDFALVPLKLRTTAIKDDTEHSAEGSFIDMNLARFYRGFVEKMGGWTKALSTALTGKCRGMFAYVDTDGLRWLLAGTHSGLYATDLDTLTDITPLGRVRRIHYADSKFVAVGDGGELSFSVDAGVTWVNVPNDEVGFGTSIIRDVTYGDGEWVIVGDHAKIARSENLSDWTVASLSAFIDTATGTRQTIYAIEYDGAGLWVAAGAGGVLISSPDLDTWTVQTSQFGSYDIHRVRHTQESSTNYHWLAGGENGRLVESASTSSPMTWSQVTDGGAPVWDIAYNHDETTWVAVGGYAKAVTCPTANPGTFTPRKSSFLAARRVQLYSGSDISGVTFTVTGTDEYGSVYSESVTGPNNNTVSTVRRYRRVTEIEADGAVGSNVEAGYVEDRDGIATAQTTGGAGPLTLDGADASGGEVDWGGENETVHSVHWYRSGGTTYWLIGGDNGKIAEATGAEPSAWAQVATPGFSPARVLALRHGGTSWAGGGDNGALRTTTDTEGDEDWTERDAGFGNDDGPSNEHGLGGLGWGAAAWSEARAGGGGWSSPAQATEIYPTTWSMSRWEGLGLANKRFGRILEWNSDTEQRATVVSGSPSRCGYMFVTPESVIVALGNNLSGTFKPMQLAHCSIGDRTTWIAAAANTARSTDLQEGGFLLAGHPGKNESLIWSDTALYAMRFQPGDIDFPYEYVLLGANCGLIGPNAAVVIDGAAFWMSRNTNFYVYDGSVPYVLECPMRKWVADQLEQVDWEEVHCGSNVSHNEIFWFFPGADQDDCGTYIIYNWKDQSWAHGLMRRTAWIDRGVFSNPLAVDWDGYIYYQENGVDADGSPMESYAETAPVDIEDGDRLLRVNRVVWDAVQEGSAALTFSFRRFPNATENTKPALAVTPSTKYKDTRIEARQVSLKISSSGIGDWWRLGNIRLRVKAGGKR